LLAEKRLHQLAEHAAASSPGASDSSKVSIGSHTLSLSPAGRLVTGNSASSSPHRAKHSPGHSPGQNEVQDSSRAKEEKWATIARVNKKKVMELENQVRGDERKIVRLERALEVLKAERVQTDQALGTILAQMEDCLDTLQCSTAAPDVPLHKAYSVARTTSRSPNSSLCNKACAVTAAVHVLCAREHTMLNSKVTQLETSLVQMHRHSEELQASLTAKLDDLEQARVLFKQIVQLLPVADRPQQDLKGMLPSSPEVSPPKLPTDELMHAAAEDPLHTAAAAAAAAEDPLQTPAAPSGISHEPLKAQIVEATSHCQASSAEVARATEKPSWFRSPAPPAELAASTYPTVSSMDWFEDAELKQAAALRGASNAATSDVDYGWEHPSVTHTTTNQDEEASNKLQLSDAHAATDHAAMKEQMRLKLAKKLTDLGMTDLGTASAQYFQVN